MFSNNGDSFNKLFKYSTFFETFQTLPFDFFPNNTRDYGLIIILNGLQTFWFQQ